MTSSFSRGLVRALMLLAVLAAVLLGWRGYQARQAKAPTPAAAAVIEPSSAIALMTRSDWTSSSGSSRASSVMSEA